MTEPTGHAGMETGEAAMSCAEECEAVVEDCIDNGYDMTSCQIKYNRCRMHCPDEAQAEQD